VSRSCACIGSPCLRQCVHGAPMIGTEACSTRSTRPGSARSVRAWRACELLHDGLQVSVSTHLSLPSECLLITRRIHGCHRDRPERPGPRADPAVVGSFQGGLHALAAGAAQRQRQPRLRLGGRGQVRRCFQSLALMLDRSVLWISEMAKSRVHCRFHSFQWNDWGCGYKIPFVCQKTQPPKC
jgi:hypothetical protein